MKKSVRTTAGTPKRIPAPTRDELDRKTDDERDEVGLIEDDE